MVIFYSYVSLPEGTIKNGPGIASQSLGSSPTTLGNVRTKKSIPSAPKKWVGEGLPWWLRDLHKGHLRREKVADFSHEKNAFSIVGLTYSYFLFKKSIETTDCLSLQALN